MLDEFFRFISKSHKHPGTAIDKHYLEEIFLINLLLVTFGSLVLLTRKGTPNGAEDENVILRKDFAGKDIHLCSFLNNICNTATAAMNLIKQGYDTQARILIRTLDERIYQCMVLFASSEDYENWGKAEEQEDAKQAHYDLFSRKGRILKRVSELEEKYLGLSDHKNEIQAWRKERESYYSMAVHGAASAVLIGSASFALEDDSAHIPNLFGIPSSASSGTLSHMIYQLHGLLLLLPEILNDVHGWHPTVEDELERIYLATSGAATILVRQWILEKNSRDSSPEQ
ncbi:MAG TPA: DUF5677 domain-containing protein [Gallionella sp.]|nr:DUF5677 domain-containing protein [Gallionella sp.]